jgi:chromosomal replication initiator protein
VKVENLKAHIQAAQERASTRVHFFFAFRSERPLVEHLREAHEAMLPEKIKIETARYYKVKTSDIESKKRSADITLPRMVAMYLIRENTDVSLADIGKLFGGRNHATVIHAIEKMEKAITEDSQLQTAVEAIEKKTREKSK